VDSTAFLPGSPGRLVPTDGETVAFLPDPIPRSLPLELRTVRLLADAQLRLGSLGGAAGRLVNPWLISAPLLRQEAILSSRIEGTVTSPEQLVLLEVGEVSARGDTPGSSGEDTKEVANFVSATRHALSALERLPVSMRLLKDTHRILMTGVRGDRERPGEVRDAQNFIGSSRDIQEARFVPPPHIELPSLLDDFERFINDESPELPLLVRVALVHYQFETLHPFRDGNGRIGRLLVLLILMRDRVLPAPLLPISAYLERHRTRYMDLLFEVSTRGAWTPWIEFFLEAVAESAAYATRQVDELLTLRERWHARFHSARSSALLLKLVDSLFHEPAITIARVASVLDVTPATATANVSKLVEAGILVEATGRKRDRIFLARDILTFMRGDFTGSESSTPAPTTSG
jgi:Fic family protein